MSENLNSENENNETETLAAESTGVTANAPDAATVQQAEKPEAETVASAVVKIEGQEFPLPVSIAADDELLKAALSPHYPSIKNANISRETRAGQMIVSIVKRAEHIRIGAANGKRKVETKSKNDRRKLDATEIVLRRLARAPETAHQIYELAESLYLRSCDDGDGEAFPGRMTLADIEQIGKYLREVETDDKEMKKQFAELATLTSEFHPPEIPVGF